MKPSLSRLCQLVAALAALLFTACEQAERAVDHFRDMTPYEAYRESLALAGLGETALVNDWIRAGQQSIREPTSVTLPFREEGLITPESPSAMAYRVSLGRGRKLTVEVALDSPDGTLLFVDLFRVPSDERHPLRPIANSDSANVTLVHEPWRGGDFIVRVQPELLRGGSFRITLQEEMQLAFPVEGEGMQAIMSRFGAPRDGGARSHAGVDIFAARGTPVLAASAGRTRGVRVTELGGKVVWVRDSVRNASIYYAHLDSQHVGNGQRVAVGDTLGFVGNTGNARTTPPHLHFGIYRRGEGAVDPYPFLEPPRRSLPSTVADATALGARGQPVRQGVPLRIAPASGAEVISELAEDVVLRVTGVSGSWFRVQTPDGGAGYLPARMFEVPAELTEEAGPG